MARTVCAVIRGGLRHLTPEEADTELAQLLAEPWLRLRLYWGSRTVVMDVVGRTGTHRDGALYASYFTTI